jgi:hypothetical protein
MFSTRSFAENFRFRSKKLPLGWSGSVVHRHSKLVFIGLVQSLEEKLKFKYIKSSIQCLNIVNFF